MSVVRYQLDEDCQSGALAAALREHGVDVLTTTESGLVGVDDDSQLTAALAAGRVIVSNNVGDFAALHSDWLSEGRSHAGMVLFPQQQFTLGEVVRRLLRIRNTLTAEQMIGRLEWLRRWTPDRSVP